jgi:hypothetical protein
MAVVSDQMKLSPPARYEGLPAPVRRYLAAAIPPKRSRVRQVRFTQAGLFCSGERTSEWQPFTAQQQVTTAPPGFVWEATIRMGRWLSVRVVDAYQNGSGSLRARLMGILPVASASGPATDEGELMRYLAEAIWYPTALVPGEGLSWQPLDEHSALAVLRDKGREVSARFCFNEQGMVFRIDGDRFRTERGGCRKRPWSAYCGAYEVRGGFRIPMEARVVWDLPDGELEYFRGRIQSIEFEP